MNFFENFLKLLSNNIYIFVFFIIFLAIIVYSILIILDVININPFEIFRMLNVCHLTKY